MAGTEGTRDVEEPVKSSPEEAGLPETQIGQTKRTWYRSVPFQIAVASGVSFTAPGMWDALGGLGAGGAAEPVSETFPRIPGPDQPKHGSLVHELNSDVGTVVRRFGRQCSCLWSLLRGLRGCRRHQQPHRTAIRSCSGCYRLPTLRRWPVHEQRPSDHLVHVVWQCVVRDLSRLLLGS